MCEGNITCEIVEEIRRKYNLANIKDIPAFVDNLDIELETYKRGYRAAMMTINDIRAVLGLRPSDSIIEAAVILQRGRKK
jgi:hypothetical protein